MICIKNGDCLELMREMKGDSVNIVLTSPPYNTGRNHGSMENHEVRYDIYLENRNIDEYSEWTIDLFNEFDRILKKDGVVLYNMSYGNENPTQMWLTIADVIKNTNFTIADNIIWKKKSALPYNDFIFFGGEYWYRILIDGKTPDDLRRYLDEIEEKAWKYDELD